MGSPIKTEILISEESTFFHTFLMICAKCQAKVMLRSEDMSVKVVNYLTFCIQNVQVISSNSLLFRSYLLNATSLWTGILYSLWEKYGDLNYISISKFRGNLVVRCHRQTVCKPWPLKLELLMQFNSNLGLYCFNDVLSCRIENLMCQIGSLIRISTED